ncbi:hypothetical protein Fmac_017359 [Flemingia macrophylla]|uniref:F-box domain-containing protein n=1 Tax=Flemingia macrophylla TaxID=520843 RepID=A0ABD1M2K6_9FABA
MENPTLPMEMMREILLRLPVRSVLRFKCVCKTWYSLISEPHFGISHYHMDAAPSYRFLLPSTGLYFESVDTDPHLPQHFSAVHLPIPPFRYMYELSTRKHILGSCRGLLLFYYHVGQFSDLILGNPSTGIYQRLPNFETPNLFLNDIRSKFLYGFGYDASTEDYLLILIPSPLYIYRYRGPRKIHVFSFKTHSWNLYYTNVLYADFIIKFRSGSLFNGALHWLVYDHKNHLVILAFDLTQRTSSKIPLLYRCNVNSVFSFSVLGECLCLCLRDRYRYCEMSEIWVMKEYRVRSSWTKLIDIPFIYPLHITKDGGIFGIYGIDGISRSLRLAKFNNKGELVDSFVYDGDQVCYYASLKSSLYRESLLSLPSVVGEQNENDQQ